MNFNKLKEGINQAFEREGHCIVFWCDPDQSLESKFDEKSRHYDDRRISLYLDDRVKVNYGKFGDLPARVKPVIGVNVK